MSDEANSSIPISDGSLSATTSEVSSTHSNITNSGTPSEKSTSSSLSEAGSVTAPSEPASSSIQIIDDSSSSNHKTANENTQCSEKRNSMPPPPTETTASLPEPAQSIPMDTSEPAAIEISESTEVEISDPKPVEASEIINKITMTEEMYDYMEEAFQEARKAMADGEVPVGCVFVYRDEVIARGGNFVNSSKNATRHAEFQCMDQTFDYCTRNSLIYEDVFTEISVFVTVEPCIMCAASLYEFGVKEIIYGCTNDRFGGKTVVDVEQIFGKNIPTLGGIRAKEAMDLLKEFYKGENPASPMPKKKKE